MARVLLDTESMRGTAGALRAGGGELTAVATRLPIEGLALMPPAVLAHVEAELASTSISLLGHAGRLDASAAGLALRVDMADAGGGHSGGVGSLAPYGFDVFAESHAGGLAATFLGSAGGLLWALPGTTFGQLLAGDSWGEQGTALKLGELWAAGSGRAGLAGSLKALGLAGSIVSDIDTLKHGPPATPVGRAATVAGKHGWGMLTDRAVTPLGHAALNAVTLGSWDHMLDAPIIAVEGIATGDFGGAANRYTEAALRGEMGGAFQGLAKGGTWLGYQIGGLLYDDGEARPSANSGGGSAW
ncbi:MAG: hypothetical protein M3340_08620 [Actinomycetota bacterium]|nr:hypothetical protein [Actinomycetota bacterium]